MHNWRLLILLIPSLLQLILSEHTFIYGRQYCTHSSRSLGDERFLHGKHRFGKATSDGERLVNQRPTDQFGIRRYRYDVRDVEPIRFSSEQRLERSIFASDDRSPVVHVRQHRTINDVSRNGIQRKIDRERNYENFRNGHNSVTSLHARLPHENRERESREHSEHRFDTRLDTRRPHIRDSRQEVPGRVVKSSTDRNNHVLTQNFRNEHNLNRQNHRDLNLKKENIPQERKNTGDSLERNIRKRSLDRNSIRDNAHTETPTDLRRERVRLGNNLRNSRQHDEDRARNRNIVRTEGRVNSHMRNTLKNTNDNERYSRVNIRERASVSIEDNSRQPDVRQINDRQIIIRRFAASSPLERDNRENGRRYTSTDRSDERNNERSFRHIIRERTVFAESVVNQSNKSRITDMRSVVRREELIRNKRDLRTDSRNEIMYSRNIRGTGNSMERDINRHNPKKSEERTDLRSMRTETRNAERYARDNRDETYYREIRQYRMERITGKRISPSREEPKNIAKNERTDTRNYERYSRDINSDRPISVDREVSKLDSRMALDLSIARSRDERDTIARVERARTRNDERYFRQQTRKSATSTEQGVRETESRRVTNVRSVESRNREELKANVYETSLPFERSILRNVIVRNRDNHNRNAQHVRTDIRNTERYSREKDFDERELLRSYMRRITDENDAKDNKRNIRIRVDRAVDRYAERYGKGNSRERTHSLNRDVRQHDLERMTDRQLTLSRDERNTNINHDRTDIRILAIAKGNAGDRSVSVDREGREWNTRRIADLQNRRNRDERNIYIRNKRSDIKNDERYSRDASRERAILMERNDENRQQPTMRIEDREIMRMNRVQNPNVRNERSNIRYIRDERIRDRTSSERAMLMERNDERRQQLAMRIEDREITRANRVQSPSVRKERSNIRYVRDERIHDRTTREKAMLKERNDEGRQQLAMRIEDREITRGNRIQNSNVRKERSNIRYARDDLSREGTSSERAMLMERNDEGRQQLAMRIEDREITRGNTFQNPNGRKERSYIRYLRDDRIRDRASRLNDREREINGRRILRDQMIMNGDERSYLRFRERQSFRDFNHERTSEAVERDTIQDPRRLISNERETRRYQIRNRDSLASPRFTHNHRIAQDHNKDHIRSSDAHVLESRKATAMRSSTSDLYRERDVREGYIRGTKNIDTRRDYVSRQNSVFTNAIRIMARSEPTHAAIKPIENDFNALFYGQYLFYAIQGFYILGVLTQVFKEKKNSKASSMGWLIPTRLVKVD